MDLKVKDLRLLVLEDSPSAMLDLVVKLGRYVDADNIYKASNYDDAMSIIKESVIDAAIVDLSMPGKNGMDFIDEVKSDETRSDIPFLVLTGVGENSLLSDSLDGTVLRYMVKPANPTLLKEALDEVILSKTYA